MEKYHSNIKNFYTHFKEISPGVILVLTTITLGMYTIIWVYNRNKDFELLDSNAPESHRGLAVMVFIPVAFFFIFHLIDKVLSTLNITQDTYFFPILLFEIAKIVSWTIIFFLIFKFLYDFCMEFSKLTKGAGFIWFTTMIIGTLGMISIFIQFYYTIPLLFFLVISTAAMQTEINSHFQKLHMNKEQDVFYF